MVELEKENAFYASHKAEFQEKYRDKWLVIVGDSLWGVFDKFAEAAEAAYKNFEPGQFMIHTPAEDDIVIQIAPIVSVVKPTEEETDDSKSTISYIEGDLVTIPYAY